MRNQPSIKKPLMQSFTSLQTSRQPKKKLRNSGISTQVRSRQPAFGTCGFTRLSVKRDCLTQKRLKSSPQFKSRYSQILKVKIDAEDGSPNRSLTSDFSVSGYPTVFLIRGDGRREHLSGYSPPEVYLARIDEALR